MQCLRKRLLREERDERKRLETLLGRTAGGAAGAAAAEGPSTVNVTVTAIAGSKVAVIKAVQGITGKSLMDSKKLIDTLPAVIKEKVPTAEAEEIKKTLEAASATVELK